MGNIRVLDQEVIEKIAAGEVIERPASVVKELIENSLDANAQKIQLYIKKGGKQSIQVIDDGEGMDPSDLPLALKRHATSKLNTIEDLSSIRTLGFRGEALPSIAAVSHLSIVSRTQHNSLGTEIKVTNGKIGKPCETGAPLGTQVDVENLFYNLPVRKKFLKSDATEKNHIIRVIERYALAHTHVGFHAKENGKTLLGPLPQNQSFLERISSVFGVSLPAELLPVQFRNEFVTLSGFITKPAVSYPNRSSQFFFVNGRAVNSRVFYTAVSDGYRTFLAHGRFPGVFIKIDIAPHLIDVNIHPAKSEIKFYNESNIYSILHQSTLQTLQTKGLVPDIRKIASPAGERERVRQTTELYFPEAPGSDKSGFGYAGQTESFSSPMVFEKDLIGDEKEPAKPVTLAQVDSRYIIAHDREGILIIDQHAAWERVLFEQIKEEYDGQSVQSQRLLVPVSIELSASASQILKTNIGRLSRLGFEIKEFGKQNFKVSSLPVVLGRGRDRDFIADLISEIVEQDFSRYASKDAIPEDITDNIFKRLACRGRELTPSIMFGDSLSKEEMQELISRLFLCKNPNTCPHGRPTMIRLSKSELERRFGRSSRKELNSRLSRKENK